MYIPIFICINIYIYLYILEFKGSYLLITNSLRKANECLKTVSAWTILFPIFCSYNIFQLLASFTGFADSHLKRDR